LNIINKITVNDAQLGCRMNKFRHLGNILYTKLIRIVMRKNVQKCFILKTKENMQRINDCSL